MSYYITVMNDNIILEKIIFSYRDEALRFVELRRKQGFVVTIKVITM